MSTSSLRPRLGWSARLVAAWLVVLVASPVTAPFKTWDLVAPVGEIQLLDGLSSDKLSKDATLPAIVSHRAPVRTGEDVHIKILLESLEPHHVLPTVLRL